MKTTPQQNVSSLPTGLLDGRLFPPAVLGIGYNPRTGQQPTATDADAEPIRLGDPGPCPPGGTTVFIVLDESASVTAGSGSDPLSRRHAETAIAIQHVAAACQCGRDRVSLVPFDRDSAGYVAPQPLIDRGVRRLDRGLNRLSGNWGLSSELGPPLNYVEAQAGRRPGDLAVVVFSDFLLTDHSPGAILDRLCAFPGYVHAVVLGSQPPPMLGANPAIAVTRLTPSSPRGAVARAVFDGLTHYRTRRTSNQGSAARDETHHDREELIA